MYSAGCYEEWHARQMQDPGFVAARAALEPEYQMARCHCASPRPDWCRRAAELRVQADVWRSIGRVNRLRWRLCKALDWLGAPEALCERVFPLGTVERERERHGGHWGSS